MAEKRYEIDRHELHKAFCAFEHYMGSERWDNLGTEGIYKDEGIESVSAFIEFIETGRVTSHDDAEVEA